MKYIVENNHIAVECAVYKQMGKHLTDCYETKIRGTSQIYKTMSPVVIQFDRITRTQVATLRS
jgi:hypothetical protein